MTNKNIYTALVEAQKSFGKIGKGSVNPAFKSKYADLSDVVSAVLPVLNEQGVCVLHYVSGDNMRTELAHAESGTKIWCDVPLVVDRQNMQGYKSATTYAKRIGLESLTGVAPEDDDGNDAGKAPPKQQAKQKQPETAIADVETAASRMVKELERKISASLTVAAVEQVYTDNKDAMNAMLSGDQKVAVIKKMAARKEAVGSAEANPFDGVQND